MAFPNLRLAFPRLARPGTQIRGYYPNHNYAEEPYFVKDVRYTWRGILYFGYPYLFYWYIIENRKSKLPHTSNTETEAGSPKSK